jgi:hypothetical protein
MEQPPEEPRSDAATLAGLAAVIALVALAVWALLAFQHSSNTMDCMAAGHHDCTPPP